MKRFKLLCFEITIKKIKTPFERKVREIVCSFLGHSRICHYCFGEITCARCGEILQDGFAGLSDTTGLVFVEHDCSICRENYKGLSWKDKVLCPYPFKKKKD